LVPAEDFEGTGAGLAIVKKVLDKLGGSIRAEAQPGQGATFFVDLSRPAKSRLDDPGRPMNVPTLARTQKACL
jgi:K+-sensing histidine kinase KdpD